MHGDRFRVCVATENACDSVQSALAALESGPCDLLLTDLGLPDGSGLEIIKSCAQQYPGRDIMVLTMSSDDKNVVACTEAGAAGYVSRMPGTRISCGPCWICTEADPLSVRLLHARCWRACAVRLGPLRQPTYLRKSGQCNLPGVEGQFLK